jgi:aryl-alcohol dehydrogenase-like predicted oxidoreductase
VNFIDTARSYGKSERLVGQVVRKQIEQRVNAIVDDLGIERDQMPEIALRYVLSDPAVSTVIPGMRTVRNVERNTAVNEVLSEEQLTVLAKHQWERDVYRPAKGS